MGHAWADADCGGVGIDVGGDGDGEDIDVAVVGDTQEKLQYCCCRDCGVQVDSWIAPQCCPPTMKSHQILPAVRL